MAEHARPLAGKYMAFRLGSEVYGLPILAVREIISVLDITRVPRTEDHVCGVINLRGRVLPVVDLGLRFGMARVDRTEQTVIIVACSEIAGVQATTGLMVDEVLEVLDIDASGVETALALRDLKAGAFIRAIGKVDEQMVLLLDVDGVLKADSAEVAA